MVEQKTGHSDKNRPVETTDGAQTYAQESATQQARRPRSGGRLRLSPTSGSRGEWVAPSDLYQPPASLAARPGSSLRLLLDS